MAIINQVVAGSGGGGPQHYIEKTVDANGKLINSSNVIDLTGVTAIGERVLQFSYAENTNANGAINWSSITSVGAYGLSQCFRASKITSLDLSGLVTIASSGCSALASNCTTITFVNLSSLTTVGNQAFNQAFRGCSNLTSFDLSSLGTLSQGSEFREAFYSTKISSVVIPKLISVGNYSIQDCFNSCTYLTSASIPMLATVSAYGCSNLFKGCTSLPTFKFESLTNCTTANQGFNSCFAGCTSLQSLWFYALTPSSFGSWSTQFNNMLSGVTGCTVHFPMAIQSTIGSWTSVTGGFAGTNTSVLYDLVTSLTGADGNTYTRSEKDSTSTATAWTYNDTLYYTLGVSNNTAGVNEPSVSDAIYSDAACTTSVTTITAIA